APTGGGVRPARPGVGGRRGSSGRGATGIVSTPPPVGSSAAPSGGAASRLPPRPLLPSQPLRSAPPSATPARPAGGAPGGCEAGRPRGGPGGGSSHHPGTPQPLPAPPPGRPTATPS